MKGVQFGLGMEIAKGIQPTVATNGKVIVMAYKTDKKSEISFRAGKKNESTVDWEGLVKCEGQQPSVAINSDNVVLSLYTNEKDILTTRLGIVEGKKLILGEPALLKAQGTNPSIDMNDKGVVLLTYQSLEEKEVHCMLGTLKGKEIHWTKSVKIDRGTEPNICLNDDGTCVITYVNTQKNGKTIRYRIGKIVGASLEFGESKHFSYGVQPSVSMTNHETVILNYLDNQGFCLQSTSKIDRSFDQPILAISSNSLYEKGFSPSVAIAKKGHFAIQVHEQSEQSIRFSTSNVVDRSNFMRDMLPAIKHLPLRKMVLPGANKTGSNYIGGYARPDVAQALSTLSQLKLGARFLDVQPNKELEYVSNWGKPTVTSVKAVLKDVKTFFDEGHQELIVLKFKLAVGTTPAKYKELIEMVKGELKSFLFTKQRVPKGVERIANTEMGHFLADGGSVLVLVDGDFALEMPENGFWVYRSASVAHPDTGKNNPSFGDITVFDEPSNTTDYGVMKNDQIGKLASFKGVCPSNPKVPCDLFTLDWTLGENPNYFTTAHEANPRLGYSMTYSEGNSKGFYPNILKVNFVEETRVVTVAQNILKESIR